MVIPTDFPHVIDWAKPDMSEGIGKSWERVNVNAMRKPV